MAIIDMTGQKIGKLTVLKRDTTKRGQAAYWICQCECGNIVSIRGSNLRDKKHPTQSCGCLLKEKKIDTTSLVGKTFGKLTVLNRDLSKEIGHGKESYWICQCKCGNQISVLGKSLISGKTKSCGCLRKELLTIKNALDLTNQKFGKVTAIKNTKQLDEHHSYIWECKCDCGQIFYASAERLQAGHINSCGCSIPISRGEEKIKKILEKANIPYIREYTFSDCRDPKTNYLLRFDFAILNNDNSINRLIEFDGIQHFKDNTLFKGTLEERQNKDNYKNQYCKQHNILLIRIPYFEYNNLSLEMIMKQPTQEKL